jgi:hypothetical protein
MNIFMISVLSAGYLFAGFVTWLKTAVEMLGNPTDNPYLIAVNSFSKTSTVAEVLTFLYLTLGWPVHHVINYFYNR